MKLSFEEKMKLVDRAYPDQEGLEMWRIRDEIYYNLSEGYDPYDWQALRERANNPQSPSPPHPNDNNPIPKSLADLQVGQRVWNVQTKEEGEILGFPTERWDNPVAVNCHWKNPTQGGWKGWMDLKDIRILKEGE